MWILNTVILLWNRWWCQEFNRKLEKDNGNRISINVYGIHKDIKNQCEDSIVGEYVNNIDENRQLNNIKKW